MDTKWKDTKGVHGIQTDSVTDGIDRHMFSFVNLFATIWIDFELNFWGFPEDSSWEFLSILHYTFLRWHLQTIETVATIVHPVEKDP